MASHKNYRFFEIDAAVYPAVTRHDHPVFELDESDIYDSSGPSLDSLDRPRKPAKRAEDPRCDEIRRKVTPSSLPVNIPDWSKIQQGEEYRRRGGMEEDCFDDDVDEGNDGGVDHRKWLPPHEFLARNRIAASFSVHVGVGRTLKGRDLSRVRNAIWAKTGFQD